MVRLRKHFLTALFLLLSSQLSHAQTTAEVNGYIRDGLGASVPRAAIEIKNSATNIARSTESNKDGFYRLTQLTPGEYALAVTRDGFAKYVNKEIHLKIGEALGVDVTLKVGQISEILFISTKAQSVADSTSSQPIRVIGVEEIGRLPINGRRFVDFALLTPFSSVSRDGRNSNNQIADGGLSFGGMRSWMNNFLIDGIESNNLYNGSIVSSISQDAVREFQVSANNYTPDLGRTAGGVVNIITKSGSNDLHGSLYYFLRNDALDARPGLTRKGENHFRQNQFGFTLGGPIQRNKTFYFGNYEGQRKAKQVGFSSAFIQNLDSINRRKADFGLRPEDPSVVPSDNYDAYLIRLDHKFSDDLGATVRYNLFNEKTKFQFVGGAVLPSAGENAFARNQSVVGSLTALSATGIGNELRAGYSRRNRRKESSSGFEVGPKGLALQLVDVGSMGHLQTNIPTQTEDEIEIADSVSYLLRSHYLKFGGGFTQVNSGATLAYFDPPSFRTNLAGFLASPPTFSLIIAQEARVPVGVKVDALSGFVQDSWRVIPSLTLNYGFRYDVEFMKATRWAPKVNSKPQLAKTDYNNFQPRVGFAYSLGEGNTVIRSAFGLFHDKRITQSLLYELTFNPVTGAGRVFSPVTNLTDAFLEFISGRSTLASQFGPLTAQGIDVNSFVNPYSIQWSMGVERAVKGDLLVGVQYLGVRGVHLITQVGGAKTNIAPWDGTTLAANGLPDYRFKLIDTNIAQYRPVASEGNSIYHGLALTFSKCFMSNLGWEANYTYSKAIDDSTHLSSSSAPQDPYRRDLERGRSNNDVRNRFTFSLMAEAPRTFPRMLRHFSFATITTVESGKPYSYRAGIDVNHDFLNTTDRVGLSGRNVFTGPSYASVDIRISRRISFSERVSLELIGEVFNIFNRFNVQDLNDVYGRPTFDQPPLTTFKTPTAAFDPRDIQLAIKLKF